GKGLLVLQDGTPSITTMLGTLLSITENGGVQCPDNSLNRGIIRASTWMQDAQAQVGEVFSVQFFAVANVPSREISFGLTWDARLLRVIAADRLISDSSLWVTAHNIDPGSDDCGSAVVHRYDDQATHLEFTDHACPYPID